MILVILNYTLVLYSHQKWILFDKYAFHLCSTEKLYLTQVEEREREKSDKLASAVEIHKALENQMESHREAHQCQLNELRKEISEKQGRIDVLTE